MRKRKESHDGPPAAGTNILFVPSSAEDPTSLGVDDLMGMINEAGASSAPAQPQEIPPSEAKTEIPPFPRADPPLPPASLPPP